jgi:predicted permease
MTRRRDRELDDEIRSHLEMAAQDRMERGASRADAEAAARRELGNVALVKEATREMWGWTWVDRLLQDLRYAARLLGRSPGFTLVAVLSLALGIGANTAIFQVINAVRLRALPVADPASLAHVRIADMTGARGNFNTRYPAVTNPIWERLRRDQRAFSGVLAWAGGTFNLAPGGVARPARGLWVSGAFFDVLGVGPAAGRLLSDADDRRGCAPRAVVSHAFWQSELGGRPAVGTTLSLDGHAVEIVGVSAAGFSGVEVGRPFDIAVPICAEPALTGGGGRLDDGTTWWLGVMGRLEPGWTLEQASAQLATISPGLFRATLPANYPAANVDQYLGFRLEAVGGGAGLSGLREDFSAPLWLLLGTAGLVLVIACVNLANLLLARASAREREFAVRLALGASRGRILRQLLVESLLLAGIGAAAGAVLAGYLSGSLVAFLDRGGRSVSLDLGTDWRVLGFTAGAAILTCVLFGLAPALRATRVAAAAVMRSSARGLTAGRERFALRRALVTLQVALSLLLLVGALLFTRTLANLLAVDPGFRADGLVVASLDMRPMRAAKDARRALHADILSRVRAVAGVHSAAEVWIVPLGGDSWGNNVWMEGSEPRTVVNSLFNRVGGGYFTTLGIPMLAGRDFSDADTPSTPPVAIVNETFARTAAAGTNTVGRRLEVEATPTRPETSYEIVGVVRDAKYLDLRQEPYPVVFLSTGQVSDAGEYARLVVRSDLAPGALTASLTRAIGDVSPAIVLTFTALEAQILETLVMERLMALLSGFFGVIAAVLAVVGLYGVIAYTVARRTNEIGVRMALGAGRRDVSRMILREAVVLIAIGMAVGLGLALAGGRAASSLLFGLEPRDPATLGAAVALLAAIALAASYLPARAAARIEPTAALRID